MPEGMTNGELLGVDNKRVTLVMLFANLTRWEMFSLSRFHEIIEADIFSEAIFVFNNDDARIIETVQENIETKFSHFPSKTFFHGENNIPKGRNIGIREAKSNDIMIWDDDDSCNPHALHSAYFDIFAPGRFDVLELPLSNGDGSSFHPQTPDLMPQIPHPQRDDLLILGMIHTPFFVKKELLKKIPLPENMALRGDWLHWSIELWRAGVPVICLKGKLASETARARKQGSTAGVDPNDFACYHVLISLLYLFYRYDVDPESEHGQIVRRRYLDKYRPDDSRIIWPQLAEIAKKMCQDEGIFVKDFVDTDSAFCDLLQKAYSEVATFALKDPHERQDPLYDLSPFEIFNPEKNEELNEIICSLDFT